jgi:hypothetical protein
MRSPAATSSFVRKRIASMKRLAKPLVIVLACALVAVPCAAAAQPPDPSPLESMLLSGSSSQYLTAYVDANKEYFARLSQSHDVWSSP